MITHPIIVLTYLIIHPFLLYLEAIEDIRDYVQENDAEYGPEKSNTDNNTSL